MAVDQYTIYPISIILKNPLGHTAGTEHFTYLKVNSTAPLKPCGYLSSLINLCLQISILYISLVNLFLKYNRLVHTFLCMLLMCVPLALNNLAIDILMPGYFSFRSKFNVTNWEVSLSISTTTGLKKFNHMGLLTGRCR